MHNALRPHRGRHARHRVWGNWMKGISCGLALMSLASLRDNKVGRQIVWFVTRYEIYFFREFNQCIFYE